MSKKHYTLVGVDGNAFAVTAYVQRAMMNERISGIEIRNYLAEATLGDYNHLLAVSLDVINRLNNGTYAEKELI